MRRDLPVLQRNLARALRGGAHEEAADLLARLKTADPLSLHTRGLELEYLVRTGRGEEATKLADGLVVQFPASARVLHWAGRAAYAVRDYDAAAARLRESGRVAPHWTTDWWLGKALTQRGDLEAAEPILARVVTDHPHVRTDLAWLYERRGDLRQALEQIEACLTAQPDNAYAQRQRLRLNALVAPAADLIEEVETLQDLGEAVPDAILPAYVEGLLRMGRSAEARHLVAQRKDTLSPRVAIGVAWRAHHLSAFDLSCELLLAHLEHNLGNLKYLNALERAARNAGRVEAVREAYRRLAPRARRLYGRIKRLGSTRE